MLNLPKLPPREKIDRNPGGFNAKPFLRKELLLSPEFCYKRTRGGGLYWHLYYCTMLDMNMTTVPLYHCTMLDMTVLDDDASLFWQCGRIQMPDADTLSIIFIIINNIFIIIIII